MTVATYHQKPRKGWPYPDRNYVEFTLEKRGQDTASVINSLAHITHRNPKMFSYYGTKDKVKDLCAYNNIQNPDDIRYGQKILIP